MAKLFVLILLSICVTESLQGLVRKTIPIGLDSNAIIDYINKMNTTWKAGQNFDGYTLEQIKGLMGALQSSNKMNKNVFKHDINGLDIPIEFDARKHWPNCTTIAQIRDQASCGSCWAFAAVEAMSDRTCIASNGKQVVELSVNDLLGCCEDCGGIGCSGGFVDAAWQYWVRHGLVSGGLYNSTTGCQPFSIPPCDHHGSGVRPKCSSKKLGPSPKCTEKCEPGYKQSYSADKHFGASTYQIDNDEQQIQVEIFKYGPVEAIFAVFDDFPLYKSGVYQRHGTVALGMHAIKVLGWGVESGTKYWLVANSWNTDWGDQGYFKILRNANECDIEAEITAGLPKLST